MSTPIARINSVDIEYIFEIDVSFELLVDRERTALGKTQQFFYGSGYKRVWSFSTRPLPYSDAKAILDEILNNDFEVDFWYDKLEQGETSVEVIAEIDDFDRVEYPDRDGGGWTDDHIEISLTLTEK